MLLGLLLQQHVDNFDDFGCLLRSKCAEGVPFGLLDFSLEVDCGDELQDVALERPELVLGLENREGVLEGKIDLVVAVHLPCRMVFAHHRDAFQEVAADNDFLGQDVDRNIAGVDVGEVILYWLRVGLGRVLEFL